MKTIKILNVKNINELVNFGVVEGRWIVGGSSDDRDRAEIENAIRANFNRGLKLKVSLFHANGHEITADLPADGTFLVSRI